MGRVDADDPRLWDEIFDNLPPVRVDNEIIWPGGGSRKMTLRERLAWRLGRRVIHR